MTASSWIISPAPLRGGPPCCHVPGGHRGLWPAASPSRRRSAAAAQVREAAGGARSTWSMGRRCVPAAEAWAGVSAAAAELATRAARAPRGAQAATRPHPGSRRAATCSSPRPDARGPRRCPPGWGEPAQHPRPSATRAPRPQAGVRPRPWCWARALPRFWGRTPPGPRSNRRLTGLTGGIPGEVSHRTVGGGGGGPPVTPASGGGRRSGAGPPLILCRSGGLGGAGDAAGRPPPPSPPAERPPPSLPEFFSRISTPLSTRAPPRQRSPPRAQGRPQPRATRTVADMLRARPPTPGSADGTAGGASSSVDPVADAPSAASPSQSTLPPRRQHGRGSTEGT